MNLGLDPIEEEGYYSIDIFQGLPWLPHWFVQRHGGCHSHLFLKELLKEPHAENIKTYRHQTGG